MLKFWLFMIWNQEVQPQNVSKWTENLQGIYLEHYLLWDEPSLNFDVNSKFDSLYSDFGQKLKIFNDEK